MPVSSLNYRPGDKEENLDSGRTSFVNSSLMLETARPFI
jgi:hypothetical protein